MMRGDFGRTSVQRIVERRLRNWEIQREQQPRPSAEKQVAVLPYIALSRAVGSGALKTAELLSARLDWPVYDKRILDQMSADNEVRRRMYHLLDEQGENWFDAILRPLTLGGEALRNDYFRRLRIAVATIATQESAIFLGRGAGLLLPPDRGVHVRLEASEPVRVAAHAERKSLASAAAAQEISRIEGERRKFIESHFGPDPFAPRRFDLVINTERFEVGHVVDLIVTALASKLPDLGHTA